MTPPKTIRDLTPEEEQAYRAWLSVTFGPMTADLPVCLADGVRAIHKGKLFGTWDGVPLPPLSWRPVDGGHS